MKTISEETRKKMSLAKSGNKHWNWGGTSPMKGKKHSEETRKKISISIIGKKRTPEQIEKLRARMIGGNCGSFKKGHKLNIGKSSYLWKGDNAGYFSLHSWVIRWKGRPEKCEMCGKTGAKKYEWANIDHKYRRVLDDYIGMCCSCHRKYDFKNNYKVKFTRKQK